MVLPDPFQPQYHGGRPRSMRVRTRKFTLQPQVRLINTSGSKAASSHRPPREEGEVLEHSVPTFPDRAAPPAPSAAAPTQALGFQIGVGQVHRKENIIRRDGPSRWPEPFDPDDDDPEEEDN